MGAGIDPAKPGVGWIVPSRPPFPTFPRPLSSVYPQEYFSGSGEGVFGGGEVLRKFAKSLRVVFGRRFLFSDGLAASVGGEVALSGLGRFPADFREALMRYFPGGKADDF